MTDAKTKSKPTNP